MKKIAKLLCVFAALALAMPAMAQFNLKKAINSAKKVGEAVTLTDEDMNNYVKEYITWMDTHNKVCEPDHPYTQRLNKLTEGLTSVNGTPLNFKVYWVVDVNAFACADGSVRVFAALMDIMSDEELLGVIGHEVGHVANKHSQLGDLGEALTNAKFSQKQENEADDYGYDFLKDNGKNPWAMSMSFKRLKAIQEEQGIGKTSKINQLFSSHPDLDKRIQRMEKRAKDEGITPPAQK